MKSAEHHFVIPLGVEEEEEERGRSTVFISYSLLLKGTSEQLKIAFPSSYHNRDPMSNVLSKLHSVASKTFSLQVKNH